MVSQNYGNWGVSNSYKVQKLNELIRGWINYFKIGSMKHLCREMDKHIRYRLRMCIWKQWETPQNRAKNLIKLGVPEWSAWKTAYLKGYAKPAKCGDIQIGINNKRLASFGLISMLDYYTERCVTWGIELNLVGQETAWENADQFYVLKDKRVW